MATSKEPRKPEDNSWNRRLIEREEWEKAQKRHNDQAMFRVTLASTVVAVIAALAAVWSGWEAHKTREEDERPFMRVTFSGVYDETIDYGTEQIRIRAPHVTLTTFGKTPSIQVHVSAHCDYEDKKLTNEIEYKAPDVTNFPGTIYPNDSNTIHCRDKIESPAKGSSDPTDRTLVLKYVGVVYYDDLAGKKHQTPFCFKWDTVHNYSYNCTIIGSKLT